MARKVSQFGHALLVLDSAYSLGVMYTRGTSHLITTRDLEGFFDHVWSVNPLVGASGPPVRGGPTVTPLSETHTVVEGHVGFSKVLSRVPAADFLMAQAAVWWGVLQQIRGHRLAGVKAGDPYYLGLAGWALSRLFRCPLAIRINGNYDRAFLATGRPAYPRLFRSRRIEKIVECFVLRRAELVMAPYQDYLDYAQANGAAPERLRKVPPAALIHRAHLVDPSERPFQAEASRILACVGRLTAVKRPAEVLEAFGLMADEHPDTTLVFYGDGDLREALSDKADALGLSQRVRFAGSVSQPELAAALAAASLVISPITGWALIEAALAGAPIVAYDLDWQADFIEDGVNGRLVEAGNVASLARVSAEMLTDTTGSASLGRVARERALESVDPEAAVALEREAWAWVGKG